MEDESQPCNYPAIALMQYFPRAKLSVSLVSVLADETSTEEVPVVTVGLADFANGSGDLYHLSRAVDNLKDLGGAIVQRALSHPKGLVLLLRHKTTGSVKEDILRRQHPIRPLLPYRPKRFQVMMGPNEDVVDWAKGNDGRQDQRNRSYINLLIEGMDTADMCVKAVRTI
jgi:hypothetical protein